MLLLEQLPSASFTFFVFLLYGKQTYIWSWWNISTGMLRHAIWESFKKHLFFYEGARCIDILYKCIPPKQYQASRIEASERNLSSCPLDSLSTIILFLSGIKREVQNITMSVSPDGDLMTTCWSSFWCRNSTAWAITLGSASSMVLSVGWLGVIQDVVETVKCLPKLFLFSNYTLHLAFIYLTYSLSYISFISLLSYLILLY